AGFHFTIGDIRGQLNKGKKTTTTKKILTLNPQTYRWTVKLVSLYSLHYVDIHRVDSSTDLA
ncbi:hypothetical protein DKP78_23720, partial [Enterococcus faecium]